MSDSSKSALSLISMHRGYSESEQRIVDYILEHQSEAPRLTAAQLSRAAATSEATVSRFCRKLGFGSFRSFQFSLARDLESQRNEGLTDEVSLDNMEQSLKNILAAKVSELNATIDGIDHDTLAAVVHAFKNAGVIEFAAVGNTNAVALDATFKFSQLGLRCMASTISETSIGFALTLRPGDRHRAHLKLRQVASTESHGKSGSRLRCHRSRHQQRQQVSTRSPGRLHL